MSTDIQPDKILAEAVDQARDALAPIADPDEIGEHIGVKAEEKRLLTHSFECLKAGYRGWRWVTTLARIPRGRNATVCEIGLLPGEDALLAPPWIPWADRVTQAELVHNVEEGLLPEELRDPKPKSRYRRITRFTNGAEVYRLGLAARMVAGLDVEKYMETPLEERKVQRRRQRGGKNRPQRRRHRPNRAKREAHGSQPKKQNQPKKKGQQGKKKKKTDDDSDSKHRKAGKKKHHKKHSKKKTHPKKSTKGHKKKNKKKHKKHSGNNKKK